MPPASTSLRVFEASKEGEAAALLVVVSTGKVRSASRMAAIKSPLSSPMDLGSRIVMSEASSRLSGGAWL